VIFEQHLGNKKKSVTTVLILFYCCMFWLLWKAIIRQCKKYIHYNGTFHIAETSALQKIVLYKPKLDKSQLCIKM